MPPPDSHASVTDRAGFVFIVVGLVIASVVGGVVIYLVARDATPEGALWALGVIAAAGMGVAVFGALMVAPERAGIALNRVEEVASAYVPTVRLRQPAGSAAVVEREGAPDIVSPADGGPPEEVRVDTPPERAAEAVSKRARVRQPKRAAATRDPGRVDPPIRTRAPEPAPQGMRPLVRDTSGDTLTGEERAELRAWLAERRKTEGG